MIKLEYKKVSFPFIENFSTTHGSKKEQEYLYVNLQVGALIGYGATPYIHYSGAQSADWEVMLGARAAVIQSYAYNGPERFWHFLHHLFPTEPYLVAALDIASWDLWGKWQRRSVRDLLDYPTATLTTDITLGAGEIEQTCERLRCLDFECIKLKWTQDNIDQLEQLVECTEAGLRLDPNGAWTLETLQDFLVHPLAQRFELIEQPCATDLTEDFRRLHNPHQVAIIADESFQTIEDLKPCAERYNGINIKLPKCGGITPARDIIELATKLGLQIMLGNMSEAQIGTAALIHLAGRANHLDLDGALLIEDSTAEGVTYPSHIPTVTDGAGLGLRVKW